MNWPMSSTLLAWLFHVSGALTSPTEELALVESGDESYLTPQGRRGISLPSTHALQRERQTRPKPGAQSHGSSPPPRSEEHTSELQSPCNLVCRLLLEKKTRWARCRTSTVEHKTAIQSLAYRH